jgi:NADH dehydrogenase
MKKHIVPQGTFFGSEKPHLVILGAGFGGMYTYKNIPAWVKKNCAITLIDKRNHFLFTPLLPEVAGASLDQHAVVEPIRDIINSSVQFIQSEIISVDTKKKCIELPDRELRYDILISALGSKTHFFGTPGADENAYILKDLDSAVTLRNRFIDSFEAASRATDPGERKKHLQFMIIGAGPTGVELIGEVADLFFKTFRKQFTEIDFNEVELILVNSGAEVLNMFDKKLRSYAASSLEKDNVIIKNIVLVAEVNETGVVTAEGEIIKVNTVIWAAGVTANSLPARCGSFEINRGRICVDDFMQANNTKEVFVVGDMSFVNTPDERGFPMTAQVAKQQGVLTGNNIGRMLQDKPLEKFVYQEKGLLASLGSFDAVAQVGPFKITGVIAWFMWRTIYLFNFASWKKRFTILADWTIGLFSGRDTSRL